MDKFETTTPSPSMGFVEAVKTCFQKYVVFTGRARRSEYWYFTLFACLVGMVVGCISNGSIAGNALCFLVFFLPGLAVQIRRLHDTGRSGWLVLLSLVPLIGSIVLLVWFCQDSAPEANKYGPSPKYGTDDEELNA